MEFTSTFLLRASATCLEVQSGLSVKVVSRIFHLKDNMAPTEFPKDPCFLTQQSPAPLKCHICVRCSCILIPDAFQDPLSELTAPGRASRGIQAARLLLPGPFAKRITCHLSFLERVPFYIVPGVLNHAVRLFLCRGGVPCRCFLGAVSWKDAC